MLVYLSVFLLPLSWYILENRYTAKKSSDRLLAVIFLLLALFVGMGDMQGGYDRYIYADNFDGIADAVRNGWEWRSYGSEYGYSLFMWIVAHFTQNRYIFILTATLTMYYFYYKAFKTYLGRYPIACMLFMGFLYYYTMTYIRQTMAVAFVLQACQYAYRRKPIPFFLWVLVAYSFHNASILFAIIYFIPLRMYSNKTILVFLFIMLLLGFTPFASALFKIFGETTETQYRTDAYAEDAYLDWGPQKVIVSVFFLYILLKFRYLTKDDPKDIFFYNLALAYCAIEIAFVRFGQGGRLGWFFFFGLIYTFSQQAYNLKAGRWLSVFIVTLSFLMFFRITYYWQPLLTPYKTFLTNGYPCSMSTYEGFEYDWRYTNDKFYRPAFDLCTRLEFKMIPQKDIQ